MPGPTSTYDPAQVFQNFMTSLISGYFDGTFLSVEFDEDSFMLKVGADGEKARARNNNRAAKCVFTLMPNAPANDVLSGYQLADQLTGAGIGPWSLRDNLGTTVFSCPDAYLLKPAKKEFGKEILGVEWTIVLPSCQPFIGGALPITA